MPLNKETKPNQTNQCYVSFANVSFVHRKLITLLVSLDSYTLKEGTYRVINGYCHRK